MAQVLRDSVVGYPEALAIFDKPIQNVGIRKYRCINYYPVNDFTTQGVIQFSVPGNGNGYIDLSKTVLNLRCKIVKRDGSDIDPWSEFLAPKDDLFDRQPAEELPVEPSGDPPSDPPSDQPGDPPADPPSNPPPSRAKRETEAKPPSGIVGITNNFMHSMFRRIDVSLQNKLLTDSDNSYPYQSYFKALFYSTKEMKKGALQMQLFYPDSYTETDSENWVLSSNPGLKTRSKFFDGSREVDMCGNLYCDIFEMNKFIPNGIGLNVVLYPNTPDFCLLSPDTDPAADYKVVVTRASLNICTVEVSPEIIAAHSEILQKEPATFLYSKSEIKKFTLTRGVYNADINDPFNGRVPAELILGIVSNSASHGDYKKNPFEFVTQKVNYVQVTLDGQDLGHSPLEMKFGPTPEDSLYMEAYKTLAGVDGTDNEIPIPRLDFPRGYCFYRFVSDHTENSSNNDDVIPLRRTGNLRVSIRFDEMLDQTMTVVMFARFPAGIKVDKNRAVYEI